MKGESCVKWTKSYFLHLNFYFTPLVGLCLEVQSGSTYVFHHLCLLPNLAAFRSSQPHFRIKDMDFALLFSIPCFVVRKEGLQNLKILNIDRSYFQALLHGLKSFTKKTGGMERYLRKSPPGVGLVDGNSSIWGKRYTALPSSLFPISPTVHTKNFKLLRQK